MLSVTLPLFMTEPASPAHDITRFIGDKSGTSYFVASWTMKVVDWLLGLLGLESNATLVTTLYAAVVFAVALVVGYVVKWIMFAILEFISRRYRGDMYNALKGVMFFHKVCRVIPALIFLMLIEFTLSAHNGLSTWLTRITIIYLIYVTAVALTALADAIWLHIDNRENKRKLPLRGLAQLVKGIVWIIAAIIIVAVTVDKSPAALLTGLGAFAAVLMLIFKDSILGLVAGVQLAEDNSLHVGDWIKVNGTDANGTVAEVSLTSVKVLNWDKTTTSLPPYSLISSGFTNYRTMQQSNTRRVCRSFYIDADSVLPTTDDMLAEISTVPYMKEYIDAKKAQKAAGKSADVFNPDGLVDGTIDTNLGLFRAYMRMWLDKNPHVSHDDTTFVSTLPQTSNGIPFQVYCFTNTSQWLPYEAIQDGIFEHLASMLHRFYLCTIEIASGRDTVVQGYLSQGNKPETIFGIPEPFLMSQVEQEAASHADVG